MPRLLIKFKISLVELTGSFFPEPHGPLFSFWLPEGEKNAIILDTGEPGAELAVWFERQGFVGEDGLIHYDSKRKEVDDKIVPRQAILDAGPLHGRLTLNDVIQDNSMLLYKTLRVQRLT